MSRNAETACINAANERDDQRETARREWLESVKTISDYAGDAYRACLYGNADRNQQRSAAAQIALLHGEKGELRDALQAAGNVLSLLSDEVKALGCKAENVPAKIRAALAKARAV